MSIHKRSHIIAALRKRGLHTAANELQNVHHDEINYDSGVFAGIAIAELLEGFVDHSESLPEPSYSLADDAMPDSSDLGGGGDFGGGGAGGDFGGGNE